MLIEPEQSIKTRMRIVECFYLGVGILLCLGTLYSLRFVPSVTLFLSSTIMYCLAIIKVTLPGFGTQMLISVLALGEASLMLHVLTIFLVGRIRGHLTVAKGYLEVPKERFFTCRPIASSREVRLLRLLPRTAETEIRYELVHTSLDNSEPYEAISYTWESPERTRRIIVDNLPFLTTEKVYSLLRVLSLLS